MRRAALIRKSYVCKLVNSVDHADSDTECEVVRRAVSAAATSDERQSVLLSVTFP